MNILVIGNGFDLAHGLPTKYTDFLYFCDAVKKIIESCKLKDIIPQKDNDYVDWINNNEEITFSSKEAYIILFELFAAIRQSRESKRDVKAYKEMFENFIKKYFYKGSINLKWLKEILYLIYNNVWIEYFLKCDMHGEENWIDFESEISKVIRAMSSAMEKYEISLYEKGRNFEDGNTYYLNQEYDKILDIIKKCKKRNEEITYVEIRNYLLADLEKIIRAFEIYLTEYVEKIEITKISKNIKDIEFDIDHVLSFNYTDTYERLYGKYNIKFDYIHGKADINKTIESNNMVLGIDEYLSKKKRNKNVDFIAFKKYYQRIYKETGCKYKDWINVIREENNIYMERKHDCEIYLENIDVLENIKEEMRAKLKRLNENPPKHNLYIFGHSLDVTDKDILRELILNDNVYTTIFYHDKDTMGQQIANLVKVIGQDELIKRTGGSTKTIEFKLQEDMIENNPTANQSL